MELQFSTNQIVSLKQSNINISTDDMKVFVESSKSDQCREAVHAWESTFTGVPSDNGMYFREANTQGEW